MRMAFGKLTEYHSSQFCARDISYPSPGFERIIHTGKKSHIEIKSTRVFEKIAKHQLCHFMYPIIKYIYLFLSFFLCKVAFIELCKCL
jgi:hypothetical protein